MLISDHLLTTKYVDGALWPLCYVWITSFKSDYSEHTGIRHCSMNDVHTHRYIDWKVNETSQDYCQIHEFDPLFKLESVIKENALPS